MDPNANIQEQRELVARLLAHQDEGGDYDLSLGEDAYRLAELVEALAEWREQGGFAPVIEGAQPRPTIVELRSAYGPDGGPLYTVVTSDPAEVAKLEQRGPQKGLEVRVRSRHIFEDAWRFMDQL